MFTNPILRTVCAIPLLVGGLMAASFPEPPSEPLAAKGAKAETAVLAGGCFWGLEGVYEHVKGVLTTRVGYAGGAKSTAKYEEVGTGTTGHAETLQLTYDPSVVTYGQLLKIFFSVVHNPTQLNYQENDHGPQYRSNIFYTNASQKTVAQDYIKILDTAKVYPDKIVTRLDAYTAFYSAEDYHQHYLDLNPRQPYIVAMDMPKIANFKKTFPDMYRQEITK